MAARQSFEFLFEALARSQIERIKLQSSETFCSLQALSNNGSNGEEDPNRPILNDLKIRKLKK